MAKKDSEQTETTEAQLEEYLANDAMPEDVAMLDDEFSLAVFKEYDQLIDLSAKVKEFNEQCPKTKLKDILNRPFIILEMKPFTSSFAGQEEVFHCYCQDAETNQLFRTVIGAGAIVDILSRAYHAGVKSGLKLEIGWVQGGAYGGYYQLV